jgi:predicted DNA-binding transcriptional regulator AlpA
MQSGRLIRINELASTSKKPGLIPASPATIWRWVKAGAFPQPVRLSDRVTAWDSAQVDAFIATRRAAQGAQAEGAAA